jgi:hypothetical protein
MSDYLAYYQSISIDLRALKIARHEIPVPPYVMEEPAWYRFPPALLPLWSRNEFIFGYWRHWFSERRTVCVKFMSEEDWHVSELGRSLTQLLYIEVLRDVQDPDNRNVVYDFAAEVDIADIDLIADLSVRVGDRPVTLRDHPEFRDDPPLCCCRDAIHLYRGDFPHLQMAMTAERLRSACSYEFDARSRDQLRSHPLAPPWIRVRDFEENDKDSLQRPVFESSLAARDLEAAWMCLNSVGWRYGDAKIAMRELASVAENPLFDRFCDAWCSLDHDDAEFY